MCPQCSFKEIIQCLELKISNNPSFLERSESKVYAFGRTTFIKLAVYECMLLIILKQKSSKACLTGFYPMGKESVFVLNSPMKTEKGIG